MKSHLGPGGCQRLGVLLDPLCSPSGDLDNLFASNPKDVSALSRRGRIVEMEKNVARTHERLAAPVDKFFPALAKNLDSDVRRNALFLDEAAAEIELDLRRRRKSDFDLFKADLHQHVEEAEFFIHIHRLGQGLIAIPQINAAPDRGTHR